MLDHTNIMEKNLNIVRGLVIDCLTCEIGRANQCSQNLTTILMKRPGLAVPIEQYVETLRGNVCDGRVNALLDLVRDAANEGRANRACVVKEFPKKPAAAVEPARENVARR
jgi:hypothetical protein